MNFKGWKALISERFPQTSYGPLIVVFALANASFGARPSDLAPTSLVWALLLSLSMFLRLRLFDELKVFALDRVINPTRPLARGALSNDEVKVGIFFLIVCEALLFIFIAPQNLHFWLAALAYSLLMYNEFFLSKFLAPLLTTYAVSHTFVSTLMGAAIWSLLRSENMSFNPQMLPFFLGNWFLFNLFEFARKSFSPSEERDNVASYTKVFGIKGAALLSFSQVGLFGYFAIHQSRVMAPSAFLPFLYFLISAYFLISVLFGFLPTERNARLFRNLTGVFLLCFYLWILAQQQWGVAT